MAGPNLNPSQQDAVESLEGPLLVLAGAGSGKTRILTYRIAHLIETGTALPGEICSLTFTNKAAKEMKERVVRLLGDRGINAQDIWISTFHSMGAKLLRIYGGRIGLDNGFTIFDDGDQLALIKDCMELAGISDKVVSPKTILHKISALKNDAIDPKDFAPSSQSFMDAKIAPIIHLYEKGLRTNNAVDFGDLVLKTYHLFRDDPEFRNSFQDRYRFLLVDEYQDTNAAQYELLRLMSQKYRNLCVVGDEDQSIYRWRGADIQNILGFEKDFPEAKTVKLEENYRSSAHIIRAANKVIANNKLRKEKTLFTSNPDGEQVQVHFLETDLDESRWVTQRMRHQFDGGMNFKDMAIFYRTNAQSRLFEDRLRYDRIPYKIFGGMKFYERAEIKDALAYLRLFVNPRDEISLQRIINVPARGIGKQTVEAVREFAQRERLPLLEAVGMVGKGESPLGSGPRKKLSGFLDLYARLQVKMREYSPVEFYAYMLDEIGYLKALEAENSIEATARLENLKELGSAISEYEARSPEPNLHGFLEEVALLNDTEKTEENPDFVSLMTIHSAKGLEFDTVFLVGLEEELFPSLRPDVYGETDSEALEEERRLAYVGITRARKHLYITSTRMRRVFGISQIRNPSRFLDELPQDEIQMHDHAPRVVRTEFFKRRSYDDHSDLGYEGKGAGSGFDSEFGQSPRPGVLRTVRRSLSGQTFDSFGDSGDRFGGAFESAPDPYKVGVKVRHPDFGEGAVIAREGQAEGLKVTIKFSQSGTKKFVVRFAPLEIVS